MALARARAFLAAAVLTAGLLFAGGAPESQADDTPTSWSLPTSLDLHDGSVSKFGSTYYAYGTSYACGFQWGVANTPWCGLRVSTAPSLAGPWSAPVRLFYQSAVDPWTGTTWQVECGGTGAGCFNARMIQRSGWGADDGVFVLWFNSPADYNRNKANAYNAMGCNGPAGPCGPGAGAPNGSYVKPALTFCTGNGDFGVIQSAAPGARPALVCTMGGALSLSVEELNTWGSGGSGAGVQNVAGLSHIEGPGGWWDAAAARYVLTYSDPGCGFCTGTAAGYATATSLYGTWSAPANLGFGQPTNGRRIFSANSCGGQPRTVSVVDGQPYQGIDLWTGERNEADAGDLFVPLTYGTATGTPGDGGIWRPPLSIAC